ncbi:diphthamide synthase [Marinoscillum furvescens DSM 4134]|uniref:Diphthamide synthase n=1 Tax=Marinoscillum furvescens DSM 4134 TaxID=1122208 RepID=A0A3D9KWR3_MARFU|nr:diphthamide synthase [Marinoscillum furvescens DSM 4134]
MHQFFNMGFRAVVVSASNQYFDESFVGAELTPQLIADLPKDVDPCGENGEFHTFCFDGPIFHEPIKFTIGEKSYREYPAPTTEGQVGFWFCDLLPHDE